MYMKCNGTVGEWCAFAAVLSGLMVEGRHHPMASGECVHIKYQYNNDTGAYDQTLSIGDKVVSTLSHSKFTDSTIKVVNLTSNRSLGESR